MAESQNVHHSWPGANIAISSGTDEPVEQGWGAVLFVDRLWPRQFGG
jgi:hypothetical protein